METTPPNVFALKNSGLDAFLYADVGTERNGSPLTILSMIARLGQDPWTEAARWAALPRSGAVESLSQSIAKMPIKPSTLTETRIIAERLVQLLPAITADRPQGDRATAVTSAPNWVPITMLYCAMALGMALFGLLTPKPLPVADTFTTRQALVVPGSVSTGVTPLVLDESHAGSAATGLSLQAR